MAKETAGSQSERTQPGGRARAGKDGVQGRVEKSESEWRAQLSPEEYQVTREAGTERPFTGRYWDTKKPGLYRCVCCGQPLFRSETKYDSGTGWPSFYEPVEKDAVREEADHSLGMARVEALCSRCDAHLGHVFPDGPAPTGSRYCMNSLSLSLEPDAEGDADG